MRSISRITRELIQILRGPGLWDKLTGQRHEPGILAEIGDSGEPAAILEITPFLLSEKRDVALAAARAIHKLTMTASAADLASLDGMWRERSPYLQGRDVGSHRLSPADVDRIGAPSDVSATLLGFASFHDSGYVREEAINKLNLITSGAELPFLFVRLNDWVPEVRDAAHKAIGSRLRPDYCDGFVANLALIARLERAGRSNHQPLIKAIYEFLQSGPCQSGLLEALSSNDRLVRR